MRSALRVLIAVSLLLAVFAASGGGVASAAETCGVDTTTDDVGTLAEVCSIDTTDIGVADCGGGGSGGGGGC